MASLCKLISLVGCCLILDSHGLDISLHAVQVGPVQSQVESRERLFQIVPPLQMKAREPLKGPFPFLFDREYDVSMADDAEDIFLSSFQFDPKDNDEDVEKIEMQRLENKRSKEERFKSLTRLFSTLKKDAVQEEDERQHSQLTTVTLQIRSDLPDGQQSPIDLGGQFPRRYVEELFIYCSPYWESLTQEERKKLPNWDELPGIANAFHWEIRDGRDGDAQRFFVYNEDPVKNVGNEPGTIYWLKGMVKSVCPACPARHWFVMPTDPTVSSHLPQPPEEQMMKSAPLLRRREKTEFDEEEVE